MEEGQIVVRENQKVTQGEAQKKLVDVIRPEIEKVLSKQIDKDKFFRVLLSALSRNPNLMECHRGILFQEIMKCAQDGLLPDGREATILSFKGQAKYIPMVYGIIKKLRESAGLKSLSSSVVYENEEFQHWVDDAGDHLVHRPNYKDDRGEPILVYALAITENNGIFIEVITKSEIEKIRSLSRSSVWNEWRDEMWKKTAIRRLAKRLPGSLDVIDIVDRDLDVELETQKENEEKRRLDSFNEKFKNE